MIIPPSITKAAKAKADISRSRWAVQHSHSHFKRALTICASLRGSTTGTGFMSALGGGAKLVGYQGMEPMF